MQPSEPERPETSLDLTFLEHDADPGPTGTSLVLPPSDPGPPPVPAGDTPPVEVPPADAPPADAPPADATPAGPLGDLVVTHFRRIEVAMLGRVLVTTLSGALPASMVRVERRRSVGRRLTGRAGDPVGVTVTAGERTLTFRAPEVGVVEATVGHTVQGIVLSTARVSVPQWLDALGEVLDGLTRDDEATRAALERALVR